VTMDSARYGEMLRDKLKQAVPSERGGQLSQGVLCVVA
jgi:hypothetical protein